MRVTEQLAQKNMKIREARKGQGAGSDDGEETMTYKYHPVSKEPLNEYGGIFERKEDSFHTRPSVFDRTAVFHTKG